MPVPIKEDPHSHVVAGFLLASPESDVTVWAGPFSPIQHANLMLDACLLCKRQKDASIMTLIRQQELDRSVSHCMCQDVNYVAPPASYRILHTTDCSHGSSPCRRLEYFESRADNTLAKYTRSAADNGLFFKLGGLLQKHLGEMRGDRTAGQTQAPGKKNQLLQNNRALFIFRRHI